MANIIESRVTLEDEVFEETIDTMEEPIEVVRPSSYNDLEDLPQINGVTLTGNKTSEELGIVTATDIENAVSAEATLRENVDTALGGRIDGEKTARENADTALGGRIDTEITNRTNADNALGTRIDNEILARQGGDNNLQTQIDAITSKSDVVDVVADYAALQAYDTQHLGNNDVIKVLDDETHNDTQTYYRWNKTAGTWTYIGSEAPYYSKGQIDQQMQAKQDKLTAGTGINLNDSTISADTTVLATKEDLEPEIVANLPTVGDTKKLYLTPTNKTASGNPITIDLKEDMGQITSIKLDGDTYQQTYTGKNLLNAPDAKVVGGEMTCTTVESNHFSCSGSVSESWGFNIVATRTTISAIPAGNYVLSISKALSFPVSFQLRSTSSGSSLIGVKTINAGSTSATFTLSETANIFTFWSSASQNTQINDTFTVQIEAGSTATSFEPYVGGVPSPNPDYPQPIQTVTGEQTVEIQGKNLFDKNKALDNFFYTSTGSKSTYSKAQFYNNRFVPTSNKITMSFSAAHDKQNGSNIEANVRIVQYDASGNFISRTMSRTNGYIFTLDANTKSFILCVDNGPDAWFDDLQVEYGSTATTYAPYSKQTLPIDLGSIELCKLGTYQDYIYKDGENWKVHKATAKQQLNGEENWAFTVNGNAWYIPTWANAVLAVVPSTNTEAAQIACAQFESVARDSVASATNGIGISASTALNIKHQDYLTSSSNFAGWVSSTKPIVYYAIRTGSQTDTTITDQTLIAQLEAVRKATLANGQNTITNVATGANLAGSMSIGYYGYNPSEYSEWLYVDGAWEQVGGRPIPTNISELENDADFVSENELQGIIAPKLQAEIVNELPVQGDEGKLYLTPKNYTTGTATGNPITISLGEDAGQITSAQLDGDTYQQSYTGKNLYKLDTGTYNELVITKNSEGGYVLNGTPTSNVQLNIDIPALSQEHTLSFSASGTSSRVYVRTRDSEGVLQDNLPITQTSGSVTSSKTIATSSLTVTTGETFSNFTIYPQLELGSSATSFEPYCGGVPSPNPDYPQPIQTVTGEQTVEIVGKNLFDKDNMDIRNGYLYSTTFSYRTTNADRTFIVPCEPNTTYTISRSVKTSSFRAAYIDLEPSEIPADASSETSLTCAGYIANNSGTSITITTSATAKSLLVHYGNTNTDGVTLIGQSVATIMVEKSTSATSYAPYHATSYPISLGSIELCKLGTYQDYIYKSGDDWKVHKAITTITVDGSEDWAYNGDNKFNAANISGMAMPINADALCYCATHIGVLSAQNGAEFTPLVADIPYATDVHKTLKTVRFKDIRFTTTTELQSWLSQNNTTIYYVVATATDTTITDQTLIAQLEAVRNATLQASNTITNTATGTNLAGNLELSYCEYDPQNRYDKWLWLDLNNNYEKLGS